MTTSVLKWLLNVIVLLGLAALGFWLTSFGLGETGKVRLQQGEQLIRYDPGYLNPGIAKDSPDSLLTATAVDAGWRVDGDAQERRSVDILEVYRGEESQFRLEQHGDAGTSWHTFGRIEWMNNSRVRFVHQNEGAPFQSYAIEVELGQE